MKRINSGKLRAVGYEPRQRVLRVEFTDGSVIEHLGVGNEVWRRLSISSSAWSYYRDNVEEEFASRRATALQATEQVKRNPLDDLFGK
ncbi:MAG: KTSC domain-containing protein [Propionivibrio sp.]